MKLNFYKNSLKIKEEKVQLIKIGLDNFKLF